MAFQFISEIHWRYGHLYHIRTLGWSLHQTSQRSFFSSDHFWSDSEWWIWSILKWSRSSFGRHRITNVLTIQSIHSFKQNNNILEVGDLSVRFNNKRYYSHTLTLRECVKVSGIPCCKWSHKIYTYFFTPVEGIALLGVWDNIFKQGSHDSVHTSLPIFTSSRTYFHRKWPSRSTIHRVVGLVIFLFF